MVDSTRYQTAAAFHELLDTLAGLDRKFFEGVNPLGDDQSVLEGYKWIPSILQVALDVYVWADAARPRFVDIVGPYKKWGGDNADAFYQYAPLDPSRTYRVVGQRGDAAYLSLTVYGGPNDGRYSERIVGTLNDRDLSFDVDGRFELTLGPGSVGRAPGVPSITLEPDAVCAITRDYLTDPSRGKRAAWQIEALEPAPPDAYREDDAELARRLRAAITWVRQQADLVPIGLGAPNTIDEPYPVPTVTFGWAAADAAYAMGSFDLGETEALVIQGRSPACAFWNLCLWNQFLHTYNYDYERVTINGAQVAYEADGSWTIVVAHDDPGHRNWVSTAGHPRGRIWFRWFLPDHTPERPTTRVLSIEDVSRLGGLG